MAKISLYGGIITIKAKQFSRKFSENVRIHAQRSIEHLLENGRDLALVDGKVIERDYAVWLDSTKYMAEFDRNVETVSDYCDYAAKSDKPLSALQLLGQNDYSPLIRLYVLREAIKNGLPLCTDDLRKLFDLLKERERAKIEQATQKAEKIEEIESQRKFDSGFYKKTPFDSRPYYNDRDES
jgi:hypothetical protein